MPSFITTDVIIIAGVILTLLFTSLKFGKSFLANFIASFYPTLVIFNNVVQLKNVDATAKIASFVGIYIVLYFITATIISSFHSFITWHKYVHGLLLSAACTSILLYIYYFVLPLTKYYNFGITIDNLFTEKVPVIVWLTAPLIILFITHRE